MVSAKPCCEKCERKFRNQRKQKTAIYQYYLGVGRNQVSQPEKVSCETCETSESVLFSILQKELDHKNEQLSVKDKQIEELNARLAEVSSALMVAQQTAQVAQALHAGTIQQQLMDGEIDSEIYTQEPAEPKRKRSWLSKIFN